ncbi:MAG: transaldolase [Actinobacteria bacterium]|nr:transaldolase [Actinomycetota bacterium]
MENEMAVYTKSAMQRLSESSDDMELWWDSSPLIFEAWAKSMVGKTTVDEKDELEKQLRILFDVNNPADTLFCGVTTNPKLTRKVLDLIPDEVNPIIDEIIKGNPAKNNYQLAWKVYKAITEKGAKLYMPLFEKSKYKMGYVSAQVDPRLVTDVREMLRQALELKKVSPNIIVKCPGSKEGIYLIQILTSIGIPTNSTLVFHVPAAIQVAKAVKRGHEIGSLWGVDYSQWRSVITMMIGRFEERQLFAESAKEVGIELSEELKRWAGIAIAKKAYNIINDPENGYLSKLLLCSARPGPGEGNIYHLEKVAGGNLVYTMNPELIDDFLKICKTKDIYSQIDEPVPAGIMEKLLKIPFFKAGYEEDGIAIEDFAGHSSFVYTRDEFSGSMKDIEDYIIVRKKKL